jgi:hypothetical protein
VRALSQLKVNVEAERVRGDGRFHLEIEVPSCQSQCLHTCVRVWHLDKVISRDVAVQKECFSANLFRLLCLNTFADTYKDFSNVSLSFVELPVWRRLELEVFEYVNEGMLPNVLNIETLVGLLV